MAMVAAFVREITTQGMTYPAGARVPEGLFTSQREASLHNTGRTYLVDEALVSDWPEPFAVLTAPTPRLLGYQEAATRYDTAKNEYEEATKALTVSLGALSEMEEATAAQQDARFDARATEVLDDVAEVEPEKLAVGTFAPVAGSIEG